jgi:5-methyltetrahydrofolate--homocysteine methyltransferase
MNLSELLSNETKTIFLDGAMGTQLAVAGVEMGGQTNITHPDEVRAIHRKYAETGIDLIITNTLTMNRVYIESHNLDVDVRDVNMAGAKLAKAAVREGQFVLGDMGSTGKMLAPNGDLKEEDAYAAFKEQAAVLAEGGVDGFIIETMFDLDETLCVLRACKESFDLPVFVSMTFNTSDNGGRTIMGNTAQECAETLTSTGASAVGANCGSVDPFQVADIIAMMRRTTSLPLLAQANAGQPKLVKGQTVFGMSAKDFAVGMSKCRDAGARLVGGCCGTSPEHIRALVDILK